MNCKYDRYRGVWLAEMIVALSVLGILLVLFALSLDAYARFNRYQLVRQQCIAAAQAQLDSFTVVGKEIPTEEFNRLWPNLDVSVDRSAGTGQWEQIELVEVTTSGKSYRNKVEIKLSRYVSPQLNQQTDAKQSRLAIQE
jgi:type II secretory pathway pseudopilin PulG